MGPFPVLAALRLLSYGQPKSENPDCAKTQNGRQRFGLSLTFFGQKTKVTNFLTIGVVHNLGPGTSKMDKSGPFLFFSILTIVELSVVNFALRSNTFERGL